MSSSLDRSEYDAPINRLKRDLEKRFRADAMPCNGQIESMIFPAGIDDKCTVSICYSEDDCAPFDCVVYIGRTVDEAITSGYELWYETVNQQASTHAQFLELSEEYKAEGVSEEEAWEKADAVMHEAWQCFTYTVKCTELASLESIKGWPESLGMDWYAVVHTREVLGLEDDSENGPYLSNDVDSSLVCIGSADDDAESMLYQIEREIPGDEIHSREASAYPLPDDLSGVWFSVSSSSYTGERYDTTVHLDGVPLSHRRKILEAL